MATGDLVTGRTRTGENYQGIDVGTDGPYTRIFRTSGRFELENTTLVRVVAPAGSPDARTAARRIAAEHRDAARTFRAVGITTDPTAPAAARTAGPASSTGTGNS